MIALADADAAAAPGYGELGPWGREIQQPCRKGVAELVNQSVTRKKAIEEDGSLMWPAYRNQCLTVATRKTMTGLGSLSMQQDLDELSEGYIEFGS